jgi:hypothetical protein
LAIGYFSVQGPTAYPAHYTGISHFISQKMPVIPAFSSNPTSTSHQKVDSLTLDLALWNSFVIGFWTLVIPPTRRLSLQKLDFSSRYLRELGVVNFPFPQNQKSQKKPVSSPKFIFQHRSQTLSPTSSVVSFAQPGNVDSPRPFPFFPSVQASGGSGSSHPKFQKKPVFARIRGLCESHPAPEKVDFPPVPISALNLQLHPSTQTWSLSTAPGCPSKKIILLFARLLELPGLARGSRRAFSAEPSHVLRQNRETTEKNVEFSVQTETFLRLPTTYANFSLRHHLFWNAGWPNGRNAFGKQSCCIRLGGPVLHSLHGWRARQRRVKHRQQHLGFRRVRSQDAL